MSQALARTLPDTWTERVPSRAGLTDAIATACRRIAPLWPLDSYVAVNPYLGFSEMPFEAAADTLGRLAGVRLSMPPAFYQEALLSGRIAPADLEAAAEAAPGGTSVEHLLRVMNGGVADGEPVRIATVAEILDRLSGGDRQVSRTAFMIDEISKFCAAYFDEGQALWPAPWRGLPLYAAWRSAARFDRNPQAMGVRNFAETVSGLPETPAEAIQVVLDGLGIPQAQWTDYLFRALFDVRGWAAYVRRIDWEGERLGQVSAALTDLLAIRVVWGYALFKQRSDPAFTDAWRAAVAQAWAAPGDAVGRSPQGAASLALHTAYERNYQRRLQAALAGARSSGEAPRPPLQAVFCIDVRSEIFRRALEQAAPGVETLGFAGFFGIPMSCGDDEHAHAQCPVLLSPAIEVQAISRQPTAQALSRGVHGLWSRLKASAVSCFGYVEAAGLGYAAKLTAAANGAVAPALPTGETANLHVHGLDAERRVGMAADILGGMSLTDGFARLVLMVGHGSSTVNNPHAAGLDCGACGGHSGAPNARVAADLLNDPRVRLGLASRGVAIPQDTWFAAAVHDTTTDQCRILDAEKIPATHAQDLRTAIAWLDAASSTARAERAPSLGATADDVVRRSRDWSQVRPEWGLAGAAAFIAAPRTVTRGVDLGGRAFLHSYERANDPDLKVLELILTAPMVVASWISLQYFASTVDPVVFGAGDKTLHNVCGRIGVLEGNAGDLRMGLPLQSVHDGKAFRHEPMRLNVLIAAAPEAISQVLARQPAVRELLDNRWLHLFTLDDDGRMSHRYVGDLAWERVA